MNYRMLLILSHVPKNAAVFSHSAYLLEIIVRGKVSVALLILIVIPGIQAVFVEAVTGVEIKPTRMAYMMMNRCVFVVRLVTLSIEMFLATLTPKVLMGI